MKTRKFTVKVPNSKTGQIYEIRVLDYIQNFLYIRPKPRDFNSLLKEDAEEDAPLVLFKLNEEQMRFYLQIEDDWCHYRPIDYVILKARQRGFSTLVAGILFTMNIYSPYRESLIIADKDDHTSRIFEMYQRFYDHLPEDIKPSLNSNKRGTVLSTKTESTISVETVSEDLARGATLKGAHASEFGMWRKQAESLASLVSAVPFSPDAMFFIESTAKGMNFFRDLFNSAYEGQNKRFKGWFAPWYTASDYKLPYNGEELYRGGMYDDEVKLYEEYKDKGMTLEGLMWRRAQIDAMGLDLFHQEYPTYPDEAFLSTGVSVFNTGAVQKRTEEVRTTVTPAKIGYFTYKAKWNESGTRVSVSDIKFIEDKNGDVTIYEKPFPGYPYVIGADPAGLNGKDSFVAQVLRHDGKCRKQVAVFSKQKMDPDEFAMQLYCLGTYYNTALVGVETNMGQNVNKRLAQCGYRKIYVRQNQLSYDEDVLNQYGVSTQASNKNDMINTLKERFREYPEEIVDIGTLQEMMVYVVLEIGARGNYILGAMQGFHDDRVMALAIAHTIALTNQQTTSVNIQVNHDEGLPWQLRSDKPKKNTNGRGIWKKSVVS